MKMKTHSREQYMVGIICALDVEKAAVESTLDEEHDKLATPGEENNHSFGRIRQHSMVVACLPAGITGTASAAMGARDMIRSFPIKAGFMVGIGGGLWSEKTDVRLWSLWSAPDHINQTIHCNGLNRKVGANNPPIRFIGWQCFVQVHR